MLSLIVRIIILSMHADEEFVRALTAAVKGYLLKDAVQEDLLRAVRAVCDGRSFFSPTIAQALADHYVRELQNRNIEDSYQLMTEREREILELLGSRRGSPYPLPTDRCCRFSS